MRTTAARIVVVLALLAACTAEGDASEPSVSQETSSTTSPVTQSVGDGVVDTPEELAAVLASAAPGEVIELADGEYQFKQRLVASASGTVEAPITLPGTRQAVIRTKNSSGDFG